MISFEIFMLGLLVVSTMSGLATEAIKIVFKENNKTYRANTLAGAVSLVLSLGIGMGYILYANVAFTSTTIVYLIALAFMSWLCAMLGYDKVIQTISQFKTTGKDE